VGTHGALNGLALSLLIDRTAGTNTSWLIVTASDETAERLYLDLRFFHDLLGLPCGPLAFLPEWETLPYEPTAPPVDLIARRMRTLDHLLQQPRTVLVTSIRVWMQRLLPRAVFLEGRFEISRGKSIERDELSGRLLRLGYRRGSVVEAPGEFGIRGGIVDLYSTAYDEPLRVEFLGDTVESIRFFDPETQQSTRKFDKAIILPAREFLRPVGDADVGAPIKPDAEWRSPSIYAAMDTLLDYFSTRPIVVLDRPASLSREADSWWDKIGEAYGRQEDREDLGPPDQLFLQWPALFGQTSDRPLLSLDPLAVPEGVWAPVVTFPAQPPTSAGLMVRGTPFTETLKILDRLRGTHRVTIVARSRGQVDRLLALFAEHDLPAEKWTASAWARPLTQKPPFFLLQGDVSAGFVSAELQLALVTEEELFAKGPRHRPQAKTKAATFLSTLEELNVGDYIVHVQHGSRCRDSTATTWSWSSPAATSSTCRWTA
jgi:transcription-repair coupling factor (superfamily II helicase)